MIEPDALADGALARPDTARKAVVDDDDLARIFVVVIGEEAAAAERDFHGAEVIGGGDAQVDLKLLAGRGVEALDVDLAPTDGAGQRQRGNDSLADDARQMLDARGDIGIELRNGFFLPVLGTGGGDAHRNDAIGGEAGRNALEADETADEQSRAGEQ